MSWFRASSVVFAVWGVVFFLFPRFSNEFAGVSYVGSGHAEDWTRIVGLLSLAIAAALNGAHVSGSADVRRVVGRSVIVMTLPCALLMTYWQIIPDRRWFRLDIVNVALLCLMSCGMFVHGWIKERDHRKV